MVDTRLTAKWLLVVALAVGPATPSLADKAIETNWRAIATANDRARLRDWRSSWIKALASARGAGHDAAIAEQGNLFEIDHAIDRARPPAGEYRCRLFKLGARMAGSPGFKANPALPCHIEDEGAMRSFRQSEGSQRPVGLIFEDNGGRSIFLGTMMFGDEARPIDYGRDKTRDLAGYVEHVDAKRWRVVLPAPHFESLLDVIEIVPAS